ncbi:hypothetical protein ACIQXV_20400 [Neobacillus sp. NPDC097160]|uniref:hypothetical protein n=1 Tax=Neobacillus sp. NPDC097160 TaxID=3364298 RepID=UPI00381B8633
MARYRMVRTDFWKNPVVMEEMSPEDKYFYRNLQRIVWTTYLTLDVAKASMLHNCGAGYILLIIDLNLKGY